jgi:hypothetical protein
MREDEFCKAGEPISTSFMSISHTLRENSSPFCVCSLTCCERMSGDFCGEGGTTASIARKRVRISEKGGRFWGSDSQQSRMSCEKAAGQSAGIGGRIPCPTPAMIPAWFIPLYGSPLVINSHKTTA